MGRRKNLIPSIRFRFEGLRQPLGVDESGEPYFSEREQRAVDWYYEHKARREAFPMAWELLVAALNGELGEGVKVAVQEGDTEQAMEALQDLLGAFGGGDF